MTPPLVVDARGEPLVVGSLVTTGDGEPPGRVVRIIDFDMDSDDEGRARGIYPCVRVQWPESAADDPEEFGTTTEATHHDDDPEPWTCDDLVSVEGELRRRTEALEMALAWVLTRSLNGMMPRGRCDTPLEFYVAKVLAAEDPREESAAVTAELQRMRSVRQSRAADVRNRMRLAVRRHG